MIDCEVESWVRKVDLSTGDEVPDMEWRRTMPDNLGSEENEHFHSFINFVKFPISSLDITDYVEGQRIVKRPSSKEIVAHLLSNISDLDFNQVGNLALISLALCEDPDLITAVPKEAPVDLFVWCISQFADSHTPLTARLWRDRLFHPPPLENREDLQLTLLLLEYFTSLWNDDNVSPFSGDEFETVFALAFCTKRGGVNRLAHLVLKQIKPTIIQSQAAALVFRRMLPYCAMSDPNGRNFALNTLEEIICQIGRLPSCASTWVSLHPYCVAASNNLLVDLKQRGLMTSQMKALIRQLMKTNKSLSKGNIKLSDWTRMELPRSLWRVQFPPPEEEIKSCNANCEQILSTMESKRRTLIPIIFCLIVLYAAYWIS